MSTSTKITISLSEDALAKVDRECEATGETRSELVLRVVEGWLSHRPRPEDDEAYIRGYQLFPESEDVQWMDEWAEDLPADPEPLPGETRR